MAIESVFYFSWLRQQSDARRPACVAVRGNALLLPTSDGSILAHTSSYEDGYWGEIGAIYSISPQFHTEFSQRGVVGHQRDFGAILVRRHWHIYLFLLQPQES